MESVMTGVIILVLGLAAALTLIRVTRGPSALDRVIASEVLITILVCALGAEAALTRHSTTLPILVSLSLLGFVSSVAVVRFVPTDLDPGGRPVPQAVRSDVPQTRDGAADPPGERP